MRSTRGDVRTPHHLTQKRPRTFVSVSALASVAAVGPNTDEQTNYLQTSYLTCNARPDISGTYPRIDLDQDARPIRVFKLIFGRQHVRNSHSNRWV